MYTNPLETIKTVFIIEPQVIKDNAEFVGSSGSTPATVDTLGFVRMRITLRLGATDIEMAQLRLLSSDAPTSDFVAVTGSAFSPLPSGTDDNKSFVYFVKLDGTQKRYWRLEATAGNGSAGSYGVAWADLARGDITPSTATLRNHAVEIFLP